jgi:hypothetical protein
MRAILVGAALMLSSPAPAQTIRPFVEAGPLAGHDRTWGQSIAAGGVLVGGGVRVGPHVEFRVAMDLTPATDVAIGPTSYYGGTPPAETARVTYLVRARDRSISAAFGWAVRVSQRLAVVPAIGWAGIHRSDSVTATTVVLATGERSERVGSNCHDSCSSAPLFGMDAVIGLTRHVSVVPDIKAIWYAPVDNGGVIVRGGLAVRWTF